MFTPGCFTGRVAFGQCPKPLPAPAGFALAVSPMSPATPGLQLQAEYALPFSKNSI